jgi:hypothetical protein
MTKQKNIILTFDYELFLGSRSGTVYNCLVKPTNKVLDVLNEHKFKSAIFFVDTSYLYLLKNTSNINCKYDFDIICKQLLRIRNEGHYIFPHIHPHWLNAKYIESINQWDLSDSSKYSFSSLNQTERADIFENSIALLESIVGKQDVLGYRAGGWCIQPFSDFKSHFLKHNIKYEFSVLPFYSCESEFQNFDFFKSPNYIKYQFENDVLVEDSFGDFSEYPISIIESNFLSRFINKIFIKFMYRKGMVNFGDGLSLYSASIKEKRSIGQEMASLELLTVVNLYKYVKQFKNYKHLHLISHPKMLNSHNIGCLDLFLKKCYSNKEVNTDFLNV